MKAALVIADMNGGDYMVSLVDEARWEQIVTASGSGSANDDLVSWLLLPKDEAEEATRNVPDRYPEADDATASSCFTQNWVCEVLGQCSWPEAEIFAVLSLQLN